ncbi:MAG: FAD-dependent oxidoreductase [Myxococcota bacterium]
MSDHPSPQPGDSVAIVGAGPAGLHLARRLLEKGIGVHVLEATDTVGGRTRTVDVGGVLQELGAVYVTPQYTLLHELMADVGLSPDNQLLPPGDDRRSARQVFVDQDGLDKPESVTLTKHLLGAVEAQTLTEALAPHGVDEDFIDRLAAVLPDSLQVGTIAGDIFRYRTLHRELFGAYTGRRPPKPSAAVLRDLDTSFGEFLTKRGLGALLNLMTFSTTVQGYGQPDELSAFYGLWWNSPPFLNDYLKSILGLGEPIVQLIRAGYQTVWNRVAEALPDGAVRTGFRVKQIQRGHRVRIESEPGERLEVDFLVWTPPLSDLLEVVETTTDRERSMFASMESATVVATLFEANSTQITAPIAYWLTDPHRIRTDGRLFSVRNSPAALGLIPVGPRQTFVAYQYRPDWAIGREATLKEQLLRDLEPWFDDVALRDQRVWRYAMRFNRAGIQQGYPWQLDDMQGAKRTWYAGASACFDSVHDVMVHNTRLLDRVGV